MFDVLQKKLQIAAAEILTRGFTLLTYEEAEYMLDYLDRHFLIRARRPLNWLTTRRGVLRIYIDN